MNEMLKPLDSRETGEGDLTLTRTPSQPITPQLAPPAYSRPASA